MYLLNRSSMKSTLAGNSESELGVSSAVSTPGRPHKKNSGRLQYRAILEAAPDAIVVADHSGKIVLVNIQAEQLFGYTRDELIGKPEEILVAEHFRVQQKDHYSRFLSPVADQPPVAGLELFGVRKDGTEFPAEVRLSPLDTKRGRLISSAIRDISERRRTEEDLRRLASIVACSDDAIIGKTLDGIITCWNAGAERMYGYSAAEAIGKSIGMLVPAERPDELPELLLRLTAGETVDHFETIRVRKTGERFDVEISLSPIRDATEKIVGASVIARDISQRKRRDSDLSRLSAAVEGSYDAIVSLTPAGTILTWNRGAERMFGYSAPEAIGRPILFLSRPDGRVESVKLLERIQRNKTVKHLETVRVKKDGTHVHVALILSPIEDGEGKVVGVSSVARDVTENKRMEEMLLQAQKMEAVGRLAGGIAHDFNNLLGVILGYTELLLEPANLDSAQRRDIEEIQKAGHRASLLTRQLLAFSRKQVLQPKVLDLNNVVGDTKNLLQRLIGEDIELTVALDPQLGHVKVDPGQIEQIILNLAVNARDAMPAGGKLVLETANIELDAAYAAQHPSTRPGLHAMLAVTDNGCGMDAKTKSRIFEPFFTTKDFGKGTGLGLSTVYGIVKQSGGSIWVYSEVGIGTTFKVYIPCVDQAVEAQPSIAAVEPTNRGQHTILVVEDDAALLEITKRSLEEVGYTVFASHSPAHAIEMLAQCDDTIHLMITDVIMPGMSGTKLAAYLAAMRPSMKVLYVSGYTDDTIVQHGVLEPGLEFLQKPFSPKTLAAKVDDLLRATLPVTNTTPAGAAASTENRDS